MTATVESRLATGELGTPHPHRSLAYVGVPGPYRVNGRLAWPRCEHRNGCWARPPYLLTVLGIHTLHGRQTTAKLMLCANHASLRTHRKLPRYGEAPV